MAKGKSTWKYNKLLTARRNYFWPGGSLIGDTGINILGMPSLNPLDSIKSEISNLGSTQGIHSNVDLRGPAGNAIRNSTVNNDGFFKKLFKGAKGILGGAAGAAVGGIGGGLLSDGMSSGAGNVLSGLSSVASAIPGPWGAVASAGLGLASGLANRMFGSKMNNENIARVEANINDLRNFQSNAADFDTLAQNWANADTGMTFSDSFIGKDGWFSNKAKNKAADLRRQVEAGVDYVQNTLENNAENIGETQMQGLLSNYAAYGGPLFAKGGKIHINPENRGKFTETKRRTGKTTEELTHSSNPLTRKRAIFAQNAKKWHHAFGGNLMTHGADFSNGMIFVGNGGSHEENPFEGVPMGVDQEGTPNLVEEGETIFNDYVFSKRLMVPKAIRNKYKLGGTKNLSFADASKQLAKESEERPNDPISKRGLQALMADLANAQEAIRGAQQENNYAALGGNLFRTGGYAYNNKANDDNIVNSELFSPFFSNGAFDFGAMYADNSAYRKRLDPIATALYKRKTDPNYQYNDTETKALQSYVNSVNKWNPNNKYGGIDELAYDKIIGDALTTNDGVTFTYNPKAKRRGYALDMKRGGHHYGVEGVVVTPEQAKKTAAANRYFEYGTGNALDYFEGRNDKGQSWLDLHPGYAFVDKNGVVRDPVDVDGVSTTYTDYFLKKAKPEAPKEDEDITEWGEGKYADWLRYAPAVGFGIGALSDALGITNKPDYGSAQAMLEASRGSGIYQPVRFNPIGNYLTYRPFDRDYYLNKMNAEAGATRRSLMNTSGGNRATAMAGLLAADNNYLNQVGSLARQAEEHNLAQRQQVEEFNRGTNMTNSQGFLQADMANQKILADLRNLSIKGSMAAAEMRERARLAADQNRSANLSGLFQTLGDIGFEEKNARMRDWAITHGVFGPGTEDAGRVRKKTKAGSKTGGTGTYNITPGEVIYDRPLLAAKGGKLKKRRKRGLTL